MALRFQYQNASLNEQARKKKQITCLAAAKPRKIKHANPKKENREFVVLFLASHEHQSSHYDDNYHYHRNSSVDVHCVVSALSSARSSRSRRAG